LRATFAFPAFVFGPQFRIVGVRRAQKLVHYNMNSGNR